MDNNNLDSTKIGEQKVSNDAIKLSDVIEVIETDMDFRESNAAKKMFNGGGVAPQPQQPQLQPAQSKRNARIRIIEQPASKALRFRYECEGRSAGSIPGATSTPENKTFPTIQVVGYQGRAVVVVSCVTKDPPYRAHPHNLVGREGCKKGVCTLEIPTDTMTVHFSNLGIQCVKKKDIEQALRVREEIRVDPFRQGFSHRSQPTSIDLNAVRLCFQVFLEGNTPGKFSLPLEPVVSEPIYDKKAMSDLSIIKLSHCVSSVDGGREDIILLCEKVAKEDIQVRFFEENGDWEAFADFQPTQVHKQHAIWFRPPRYKTLEVTEPVKVFIQLRRPSDGAISEPLPFELWPLDSGRPPFWRRNYTKKANYNLFNTILANDAKLIAKRQLGNVQETEKVASDQETNNNQVNIENKELDYTEVKKKKHDETATTTNSYNELINQVAELDEIYADTQARLMDESLTDIKKPSFEKLPHNESFDDSKTYSSLQLAFKNPIEIDLKKYEDVIVNPPSPVINVTTGNKRENEPEKLPPLPPKRTKKIETYIGGSMTSLQQQQNMSTVNVAPTKTTPTTVTRSHSFNFQRPVSPPMKHLPPTPCSTLPNPKKRGFFSKLFGRKSKTANNSRETSVSPSLGGLQVDSNLAKSASNVSTHSVNSIRIPLKDTPPPETIPDLNPIENIISSQDVDMNLDLTEAEHYALYTAIAPHATQSEFDEMSCYYAPVEGGKLLTNAEVLARLSSTT